MSDDSDPAGTLVMARTHYASLPAGVHTLVDRRGQFWTTTMHPETKTLQGHVCPERKQGKGAQPVKNGWRLWHTNTSAD